MTDVNTLVVIIVFYLDLNLVFFTFAYSHLRFTFEEVNLDTLLISFNLLNAIDLNCLIQKPLEEIIASTKIGRDN